MMLKLTILVLLSSPSSQQFLTPWALNQRVNIIDSWGQCGDQGTKALLWDLKLNRLSRQKVVLQGNISLDVPLDDKVAGAVVYSEKGNGGWVKQGFVFKMNNLCRDMLLTLHKTWTSLWEKAGISPPITCPIAKGNYILKDFEISEMMKQMSGFIKVGTYKAELQFLSQDKTRLGCIEVFFHTAARPK